MSLLSVTKSQNPEDPKSRFDKILADFGFSDFNINTLSLNSASGQNAPVSPPLSQFPGVNKIVASNPEIALRDRGQAKPTSNNSGGSPLNNLIDIASGRNRKVYLN